MEKDSPEPDGSGGAQTNWSPIFWSSKRLSGQGWGWGSFLGWSLTRFSAGSCVTSGKIRQIFHVLFDFDFDFGIFVIKSRSKQTIINRDGVMRHLALNCHERARKFKLAPQSHNRLVERGKMQKLNLRLPRERSHYELRNQQFCSVQSTWYPSLASLFHTSIDWRGEDCFLEIETCW